MVGSLNTSSPRVIGYYPNPSKTWLVVKDAYHAEAATLFEDSGVAVTSEGRRHLGAAIGKETFVESYVQQKVLAWTHEVEHVASIAITQPHVAYAAYIRGLSSKWWYLARTLPGIADLYQPLEQAIRLKFLPSLTGQSPFSDVTRDLMALPTRLGGLGIVDPSKQTQF